MESSRSEPVGPEMGASTALSVGSRLAVLGGWDPQTFEPVAEVHVLDATTGVWRRGVPMRLARSFFACVEAGGKTYVAGGHDKLKNVLKTAEAYDAEADAWDPLPDMSTVAGDQFLGVSGYRTGHQGGFQRDAEWFDLATSGWRRLERVRAPPSAAPVVVGGRVWCIEGIAVMEWRGERWGWHEVGPYLPGLKAGTARAVAVGGGERVVVTSAIESEFAGFVFFLASARV